MIRDKKPSDCYCPPGSCQAPVIMGRQVPCSNPEKAKGSIQCCENGKFNEAHECRKQSAQGGARECQCGDGGCIECWPENRTKESLIEELKRLRRELDAYSTQSAAPECSTCGSSMTFTPVCNPCIDRISREVTAEIKAEQAQPAGLACLECGHVHQHPKICSAPYGIDSKCVCKAAAQPAGQGVEAHSCGAFPNYMPCGECKGVEAMAVREMKTNRMVHEEAAGMGLSPEFFKISNIDPDAPYIETSVEAQLSTAVVQSQIAHDDLCRLSRVFVEHSDYAYNPQDKRIHEWLNNQLVTLARHLKVETRTPESETK